MHSVRKWFRSHGLSSAIPQRRHGRSSLCLETLEVRTVPNAGTLDPSFGNGGTVSIPLNASTASEGLNALVIQPDGKLVAAGGVDLSQGADFAVARFNPNGTLDQGFGTSGSTLTKLSNLPPGFADDTVGKGVVLQPDGKIILAGLYSAGGGVSHFGLVRYNPDGSLDNSFGSGGIVETAVDGDDYATALALQPDGKIVVVGAAGPGNNASNFAVVRYNADGSLDTTFGTNGVVETPPPGPTDAAANAVLLQPDGKIVVGGQTSPGGDSDYAVLRYNPDGTLDPTFGVGGEVLDNFGSQFSNDEVRALALQPDGKIVAAGSVAATQGLNDVALARYSTDGSLDTSFNGTGRTTSNFSGGDDAGSAVAIQSNGQIVVAGSYGPFNQGGSIFLTARYNPDGTLDTANFGSAGYVTLNLGGTSNARAVTLQPDGKIVVGGNDGAGNWSVARYLGNPIDPTTLTGSAATSTIAYGTPSITVAGQLSSNGSLPIPAGEVITVTLNGVTQNATLDDNDDFSVNFDSSALGVAGSPYTITMTYAGDSSFSAATASSTLTVNPIPLTITATDETKTYGQALIFAGTEVTVSGLLNTDSVAHVTLVSPGAAGTAKVAGSPFAITASSAMGTGLGNYTITYVSGTLTVNPAPLTITANVENKTYGQTLTFAGTEFTASGLFNSDSVTQVTLASAGTAATATVAGSPYTITASSAVGTGLVNYTIAYVNGTLTVNAAPLTITANAENKTYGQTVTFAGSEFTASRLLNSDSVAQVTLASPGAAATATVAGSPYAITASSAVGTGLGNYTIAYVNGTLTVNPAPLTITASNKTKTYGQTVTFAGSEFIASGLLNSDTVTGVTLVSPGSAASATVAGSTYPITASAALGTGLGNYTITYANGTMTVVPAPLVITAGNQSKTYGQTITSAGTAFSASGLVNQDAVTQVTLVSPGCVAFAPVAASPYAITPSAAVGTGLANYTITYKNGQLTVIPYSLSYAIGNDTQVSGVPANLAKDLVATISTGLNSETLDISYTSSGDTATTKVGPYSIIGILSNGTGMLSNYNVALTKGTLTVTPGAPVQIVATSGSGQSAGFGTGFAKSLVAEVMDINGDAVPGVQVTFAGPTSGPGVQQSGVGATTGMDGTARLAITANGLVGSYQISVAASGVAVPATYQLTNFPATITGTLFQDANLNGARDAGETGMAGQTVFIDLNGSGFLQPNDPITTTDSQGNYQFSVSTTGTYTVREILLGGVLLNSPAGNTVSVTQGVTLSGQNFADVPTSNTIPLNLPPTKTFPGQGAPNPDFVEAVYRTVLGRNADSVGLADWENYLDAGILTRQAVVQAIWHSSEHFRDEVSSYYHTILGRNPDQAGLAAWVNALSSGTTEEQVVVSFLASPEMVNRGDKAFVDQMYLTLLGRAADPAGEANWLSALGDNASGMPAKPRTLTYAQVVQDILFSTESMTRLIEGNYLLLLQRTADPTGLNNWLQELQTGTHFASVAEGLMASTEFFNNAAMNR